MPLRSTLPIALALLAFLGLAGAATACPGPYAQTVPKYTGSCVYAPITPVVPWTASCASSLILHAGKVGAWALGTAGSTADWTLRTASNELFGTAC